MVQFHLKIDGEKRGRNTEATREVRKRLKSDTLAETYLGTYNLPNHTMDEMEDKELNPENRSPDGTRPTARRPT